MQVEQTEGLEKGLMQEAQRFFVLTQTDNLWKEHLQVSWDPAKLSSYQHCWGRLLVNHFCAEQGASSACAAGIVQIIPCISRCTLAMTAAGRAGFAHA